MTKWASGKPARQKLNVLFVTGLEARKVLGFFKKKLVAKAKIYLVEEIKPLSES